MLLSTQEETIRRIVLALSIIPLSLAAAHASSSTARSLALPRSDYPAKAQVVALPATNAQADRLLGPAHHSSFDQLHRLDGLGWLQAAVWHFKTGKGRAVQDHQTVFGYGINVFHSGAQARRALTDVKIKPKTFKVSRLSALLFQSTDVRQTLLFVFFAYKSVEVEAYYEYTGVAPAKMAKRLHHIFSRQSSHLAHLARLLSRSLGQSPVAPTATASATAMPTATVTATAAPPSPSPTVTRVPTLTATPTALPTATSTPPPTPTAAPTATPTPAGFVVQAQMSSQAYAPDSRATVQVQVTQDWKPVAGATLSANFQFPKKPDTCVGTTDQTGAASCSVVVPKLPDGLQVQVDVQVVGPKGDNVAEVLTFTVHAVAAE